MDERIIKKISSIVRYQFPTFYQEEGETFIEFVKAYYEWLELDGNINELGRNFFNNRDIDNTLEDFLYFYQKKYLYGIPFDVIINKRYLLKHVLDVYRSKGSIQAYRLLFKLIYDEKIDVYLPGRDVLRFSDGTWFNPYYLEITNTDNAKSFVGKTIYGLSSKVKAIVENYVNIPVNKNILGIFYISNIQPKNGLFIKGEKVIDIEDLGSANIYSIISQNPSIVGSLSTLEILNGGRGFSKGDLIKIIHKDPDTKEVLSFGKEGIVRVTNTSIGRGTIQFSVINEGTGLSNTNYNVWVFNDPSDNTGANATFSIGTLVNASSISYNEDLIGDYADVTLNATAYNFPGNSTSNATSTMESCLDFNEDTFGGVGELIQIRSGNNYTRSPLPLVRTTQTGYNLPGIVSYDTSSNTITGTSTEFTRFLSNGDVVALQANTSLANTIEKCVIETVTNNTILILKGPPTRNSTASAKYRMAPNLLESQFTYYEFPMERNDGLITGEDSDINGDVSIGNNVVYTVSAIDSGFGYIEGETVKCYLYGKVSTPIIVNTGLGYTNGDILYFNGGDPVGIAQGFINTNSNGSIANVTMTYNGTGYKGVPNIIIRSSTGNNAILTTTIEEYDLTYEVTGRVVKSGVGKSIGRWTSTRGFFNSDKYIQDSYFYQDFSYQIKAATSLSKYREILYNTFHIAGTELFGETLIVESVENTISLLSSSNSIIETIGYTPSVDHTEYRNSQYIGAGV